jgi:hypothetical protein
MRPEPLLDFSNIRHALFRHLTAPADTFQRSFPEHPRTAPGALSEAFYAALRGLQRSIDDAFYVAPGSIRTWNFIPRLCRLLEISPLLKRPGAPSSERHFQGVKCPIWSPSHGVKLAALPPPPPLRTLFDLRSCCATLPYAPLFSISCLWLSARRSESSQPGDPLRTIGKMGYCICSLLIARPAEPRESLALPGFRE